MAPMNMEPKMDIPRQNIVPAQQGIRKVVTACSDVVKVITVVT